MEEKNPKNLQIGSTSFDLATITPIQRKYLEREARLLKQSSGLKISNTNDLLALNNLKHPSPNLDKLMTKRKPTS